MMTGGNRLGRSLLVALALLVTVGGAARGATREVQLADTLFVEDLLVMPGTTGYGEIQRDRSVTGKPLSIGGKVFATGLGVHADSDLFFLLKGESQSFRAMVGVDDAPERSGTVVFEVWADGEKLFDSGTMKKGDPALLVTVPLAGKKILRLHAGDAGDGKNYDHADWAEAVFTVGGGAPEACPEWMTRMPCDQFIAAEPVASMPLTAVEPGQAGCTIIAGYCG